MFELLLAPLLESLRPHFMLSKSRLVTLAVMMVGLANCRTVNLSHLASQFPGAAQHASSYRRLQRFFQHVRLDGTTVARLVVRMLRQDRCRKLLALDRTNWKLGDRDVNVLVLALVTQRFRVPLLWTLLPHAGASSTEQRIQLMQRYLALFGASSIEMLLADREFIGTDWMNFLCKNKIPFVIRLREDLRFRLEDGRTPSFRLLRRSRARGTWTGWLEAMKVTPENRLTFVMKRLGNDETLILATNTATPGRALRLYRQRWAIECLFADAKSRGLNIEDTHITDPGKLDTLLAIVTLAMTWACRAATRIMGRSKLPRKAHGRREKSWFRKGLDSLRRWIIHDPAAALDAWSAAIPKTPFKQTETC